MVSKEPFKIIFSKWPLVHRLSQAGFTVIEVLVSMAIFSIAILGLAAGATSVMRANQTSRLSNIATNLAQQQLEQLKSRTVANVTSCSSNCDNPVPTYQSVAFTRTWTVTANTPALGVTQIAVTVQWTDYTNHTVTITSSVSQ
ncbi:MAG: prepilin-type N-terminal cleavage/methylation domain-containing protein [Candidatus Binatia bacterium]